MTGCDKREAAGSSQSPASSGTQEGGGAKGADKKADPVPLPKKEVRRERPEVEQALRQFTVDWENVAAQSQGENTLAKQKELALAVLPKLGGGEQLLKFLDYLTERGAGDLRKELIEKHLGEVFKGPQAESAREWLLTVKDEKLRVILSQAAGEAFSGIGFKDYFEKMGVQGGLHSQAALLKGYCMTMAKTNPEAAVQAYKDLGYPMRIDNTGMADVLSAMPPTTDFLKFATGLSDDSKTLAKRSRTALLRNWAGVKPEDAAQYVVGNANSSVAPDQMAEVVAVWAKASPESAGSWLAKAPAGPAKDEGSTALAKFWMASDPVKAWESVSKVGDLNKKVEIATAVFREWEKKDRDAAMKAWVEVFPEQ
jgi:hypothetical protein